VGKEQILVMIKILISDIQLANCWVMVNLVIHMLLLIRVMEIELLSKELTKIRYCFLFLLLFCELGLYCGFWRTIIKVFFIFVIVVNIYVGFIGAVEDSEKILKGVFAFCYR